MFICIHLQFLVGLRVYIRIPTIQYHTNKTEIQGKSSLPNSTPERSPAAAARQRMRAKIWKKWSEGCCWLSTVFAQQNRRRRTSAAVETNPTREDKVAGACSQEHRPTPVDGQGRWQVARTRSATGSTLDARRKKNERESVKRRERPKLGLGCVSLFKKKTKMAFCN